MQPTHQHTLRRFAAVLAACALALTGCSSSDDESQDDEDVRVVSDPTFESGTTMDELHSAGKVRIGVRFDQPGIGYKASGAKAPEGFDVEIAKIIAGELGLNPDQIEWVETEAKNRETFLENDKVDLVVASYTITDERRKVVGMAGPYYDTGQQLLVRSTTTGISGPQDVKGKKVCAATGSTSFTRIKETYGADAVSEATNSQCVKLLLDGSVEAVTTDGAILLGYASEQPSKLKVVGQPFTDDSYGVGYRKGDTAMCQFINSALEHSYWRGSWDKALFKTLWRTTRDRPNPPVVEDCP